MCSSARRPQVTCMHIKFRKNWHSRNTELLIVSTLNLVGQVCSVWRTLRWAWPLDSWKGGSEATERIQEEVGIFPKVHIEGWHLGAWWIRQWREKWEKRRRQSWWAMESPRMVWEEGSWGVEVGKETDKECFQKSRRGTRSRKGLTNVSDLPKSLEFCLWRWVDGGARRGDKRLEWAQGAGSSEPTPLSQERLGSHQKEIRVLRE